MNRGEAIIAASWALGEKNDCSVRATAVVTGLDYGVVHAAFEKAGRKRRQSTPIFVTLRVLRKLGFGCKPVKVKAKTLRTLKQSQELPLRGSFLVRSARHLTGVKNRIFLDWAAETRKRICNVWEVRNSITKNR